jgi:hypothetical protein
MSAIATKNSNAAFNRIFVAGVGVIVVAGVGAVVGHDVLDGLHVDRDCRPNIELCAAPVAVMPKDHTHDPEPTAPSQGRLTVTVITSSATSTLLPPMFTGR